MTAVILTVLGLFIIMLFLTPFIKIIQFCLKYIGEYFVQAVVYTFWVINIFLFFAFLYMYFSARSEQIKKEEEMHQRV